MKVLKPIILTILLILGGIFAFPFALLSCIEKYTFNLRICFSLGAHAVALFPGIPGNFIRTAYYMMTLSKCSPTAIISFGSYFSDRRARIYNNAGMGAYCVIGYADIQEGTRIASHVSIISGLHEHGNSSGQGAAGFDEGKREKVTIGKNCWIGERAVVGANVGDDSIVGLGAVVINDVPSGSMVMGNPGRLLPRTKKADD